MASPITYTIAPCHAAFTRRGYEVQLYQDGRPYDRAVRVECPASRYPVRFFIDRDPVHFFGNDGRKVRAEALAFVRSYNATPHEVA